MRYKNKKEILRKTKDDFFEFATQLGQFAVDISFPAYSQIRIDGFSRGRYYYQLDKFASIGLLKKVKRNSRVVYMLTEKGKKLRNKPTVKINRADGLASIVIFDIPEGKRNARNTLRRYLIRNGYTQIQKSVFISPFKFFNELLEFIDEMGIRDYVSLISGKIDRIV